MKHIVFIKNLNSKEDVVAIENVLEETRLEYLVSLHTQSVTIEGNNDDLYLGKQVLMQAGYVIQ